VHLRLGTIGPIGRSVDDLILVMKSLIAKETRIFDKFTPYLPWNDEQKCNDALNIGILEVEPFLGACSATRRAVKEASNALSKEGHHIILLDKIPNFEKIALLIPQLCNLEGDYKGVTEGLRGETVVEELRNNVKRGKNPEFLWKLIGLLLNLCGEKRAKKLIDNSYELTMKKYLVWAADILIWKMQFIEYWTSLKLDALIMPVIATPAWRHGDSKLIGAFGFGYTMLGSVIGCPAGTIPITQVKKEEQFFKDEHLDMFTKKFNKVLQQSDGMPIAVQVMTLPYEDEKCLAIMKILESQVRFKKLAPISNLLT